MNEAIDAALVVAWIAFFMLVVAGFLGPVIATINAVESKDGTVDVGIGCVLYVSALILIWLLVFKLIIPLGGIDV